MILLSTAPAAVRVGSPVQTLENTPCETQVSNSAPAAARHAEPGPSTSKTGISKSFNLDDMSGSDDR